MTDNHLIVVWRETHSIRTMIRGLILLQPVLCLSVFLDLLSDPSIWVLRPLGTNAAVSWKKMSHDYHISDLVWKKERKARAEQKEDGEFCFTPSCAVPFLWTVSHPSIWF
jgi:hypothetical protein